jgi:hypothetical protein
MRSRTSSLRSPGQALRARRDAPARSSRPAAVLLAVALGLFGCGNYSTEDLKFLAALPQREDLRFGVPAPAQAGALSSCAAGEAKVWLAAKPTSDGIDAGVDFLLALVDLVRRQPPTWRADDLRGWGPFDAERRPGREVQVVIARTFPPGLVGAPRYAYAFQARWKGTAEFTTILAGEFDGGSASRGRGGLLLDFEALRRLSMADPETPAGTMQVAYDRTGDPVTLELALASDGFGVVRFGYRFAGYATGGGVFDFAFRDGSGNVFVVATAYDARGAGRADVGFQAASGATGGFQQCWGPGACLVFVQDAGNYSGACGGAPCDLGSASDCPDGVPASPF